MYKAKQKILFMFFLIIMITILVVPEKSFSAATTTNDYTIQEYNIDMVVNEDNTFDITEKITANFNVAKHGIYRKIPLKNSIKRTDGTKSNNKAKVSDISVSEDYTTSNENGYKIIKIGNTNRTFKGTHAYTIKYKYDIGKDPVKDIDELYFNLIGSEWDAPISNVSFNITMPETFDESKLGFSSGNVGSTNSSDITYNVNDNTITGDLIGTLMPGQALTVRLTLPEGYFSKAKSNFDIFPIIVIIICVIFVLIADKLWRKYGKDNKVIETVEFYPPEGLNSAEVAYLYKGENSNEGVVSLLIYLADKGCIKIEEEKDKFVIKKLKEYRGYNESERLFFEGLFEKGKSVVTEKDLKYKFYSTIGEINKELKQFKDKIFDKKGSTKIKWVILMIIALIILVFIVPIMKYGDISTSMQSIFNILFFAIISSLFIVIAIRARKNKRQRLLFIGLCVLFIVPLLQAVGSVFGDIPWEFIYETQLDLIMAFVGVLSLITLIIFAIVMPKRTEYGIKMLGKIKGFKRFLETAEKEQLEKLVKKNPEYFYKILPYTYALEVSDVWISRFETITLKEPDWYSSYRTFNTRDFGTFMNSSMSRMQSSMCVNPSSGGGFSGGGFSGGGFSGGGFSGGRRRILVINKKFNY